MLPIAIVSSVLLLVAQPTATLPATPQGKHVEAFVAALNTSEAAFIKFIESQSIPKRTPDQQKTMYARMKKDFGTFKIASVLSASPERITVAVAHPEGLAATFSFLFEKVAPFRITGLEVEVN